MACFIFVGQAKEKAHGDARVAFNAIDFMIKRGIKQIDIATARRELAVSLPAMTPLW